MSEKLYEALEVCLHALETGADPNSVLALYPDLEGELRPLLETSRQAGMLAAPEVPEAALRRGRARVLGHAAGMRAAAVKTRQRRALFSFSRLAVSLAIALVFLLSGTGLVRASAGAVPGDNLYPLKRTWEDVRLLLVFNPQGREELEDEFEQERLHEIDELLAEGRHEPIAFAGVVTAQGGDLWVVSGVTVRVTPETRLPARPVTLGTSVFLQGWTDAQGFVQADLVELLGAVRADPTRQPAAEETQGGNDDNGNSGPNENSNESQDGDNSGPSPDHDNEDGGDENNNENDNDGHGDGENDNSGKNENDHDGGQGDDGHNDNSGPDEGQGGNDNESKE